MKRAYFIITITLLISLMAMSASAQNKPENLRTQAASHEKEGNYKEAYEIYQQLLDQKLNPESANDLSQAQSCLQQLNRIAEVDALIENTIAKQPTNPSLLDRAALIYTGLSHYGYIVAGKFERGDHRGGGQYAECSERDRIRAIQLYLQALQHWPTDGEDGEEPDKAGLYTRLAGAISMGRQGNAAWKLQILSDLSKLPDHEPGNRWQRGGRDPKGAPVNAEGKPLFYSIPNSWDEAENDGERWRHALHQAAMLNPGQEDHYRSNWANFLHSQFGVKTMARYRWFGSIDMDDQKGILQLHTLSDQETVAKLATGVKRFLLPADQNFISIYKDLSQRNENAADRLIQIYLDRRQHQKSVALLEATIANFPKSGSTKTRKNLLKQITGNWGRFNTSNNASPAGTEPKLIYTFRNTKSVTLVAHQVDLTRMVNDLWKYIESNPTKLDHNIIRWHSLGNDLVNGSRKKYLGEEVARRTHTLKPRAHHWDANASLSVPVTKPGAYLVSAELENGVTNHTVIWIDAISIVKKDVKGGELFYIADAVTGKPIPSAKVEFFGYDIVHRKKPGLLKKYDILTQRITKTTGQDGTLFVKNGELPTITSG